MKGRKDAPQPAPAPAGGPPAEAPPGAGTAPAAGPELDPLRADLERARAREDELLRALAEMTNVQKRRRQEMDSALLHAAEPLLRELLPVLDDLERALSAMQGREDDPLRKGVLLVQERLWRTLEREGLEAFRPQGAAFDPELHDALMQRPAPGAAPNTVLEVVKPGYRYRGRVIRHAQVVVAAEAGREAAPAAPEAASPESARTEGTRT